MHNSKLHIVQHESRNRYTGLPEMAFYRPPDPVNVKAAKNALKIIAWSFILFGLPLWVEYFREIWRAQ